MHLVTKKRLQEFWSAYPDSETSLTHWFRIVKKADWTSLADIRKDFPHVDLVGDCVVFNIGGNKYRLIVKVRYRSRAVFVRFVMTHSEYNKEKWKADCR